MTDFDIAQYLKPGDRVLIGQAAAEPPELVRQLIAASHTVADLSVFCGYTLSDEWRAARAAPLAVRSYVAHGALRPLAAAGRLDIVPLHLSRVEHAIECGDLPVDVVLLQVGVKGEDGCYDLGATVDHAWVAAQHARAVLVQVNPNMPRTHAARRLPASRVAAAIEVSRPLAGSPAREPNDAELRVAANVAKYVRSGSTVQLGASALADAIARELRDRRRLRVRSGLVGDWLVDLHEAGALATAAASIVTGMALGSERLYRFLDGNDAIEWCPSSELVAPNELADCQHFVALNSAIDVDLLGQVNAEVVDGRYVGAVGGQVDFFRATRMSRSGTAIIAMSSTSPAGQSRIVARLAGPVSTLKNDYDVVVTEWGAAEIGALSYPDRVAALIEVAHPDYRDALRADRPVWL